MSKKSIRKATHFKSTDAHHQSLTVYNNGFGVVQETRSLSMSAGKNEIQLEGMPQQYVPNSILVLSLDGDVTLGPISYQAPNFNSQRLLAALEGSQVELKFRSSSGKQRSTRGTLAHFLGDKVLLVKDDGRNAIVNTAEIEEVGFEGALPEGLSKKASLIVGAEAATSGGVKARILYRAAGFNWSALHSAIYDEKKGEITRFESWAAVNNGSGASYSDAALTLLAGNIQPQDDFGGGGHLEGVAMAAAAPMAKRASLRQAKAESVGEQKLYVVPERVTINEGENKQIPLFAANKVPVTREYFLPAVPVYYRAQQANGQTLVPVSIRLKLKNDKESKLGTALPAGQVSVYEQDSRGDMQMTATASIDHTAVGEAFSIHMGASTDIKAERKLLESVSQTPDSGSDEGHFPIKPLGGPNVGLPGHGAADMARRSVEQSGDEEEAPKYRIETWEVTVHNFKSDRDVEVAVHEEFPEEHEILESSHTFKKHGATNFTVTVKAPKGGKVTITYRLRIKE